jgi:integrase
MGRHKEDFTLYARTMKDGRKVWYYQTWDGDRRIPGQSTGLTSKTDARKYCARLKAEGRLVPVPAEMQEQNPTLREWAESEHWWQWGECRYLRGQLARSDEDKPGVSHRYADDALRDLRQWILPYHGDKRLDEITPKDCERLLFTWQEKGLSKKSINNKASVYRIMLSEAARLGTISVNPWDRVKAFKPSARPKGILTIEEARTLLDPARVSEIWSGNQVYYSASLLAAVTGMRLGEVLALKGSDIFPDHVHVAGSWASGYGTGKTKTKRVDDIPIPRFVYDTIDSWRAWEGFVFSLTAGARPVGKDATLRALRTALVKIGVSRADQKQRNIGFHSWRAFANTFMRARGIPDAKVRMLTRHASEEMTEHYSAFRLEDFADVAAAQKELLRPPEEKKSN